MKYVSSEYIASGHFTPGGEAALKDMAGHPRAGVDETAVAPMCLAPGARQTFSDGGREDEMHGVGYQAIGPALHAVGPAALCQKIGVKRIVPVFQKKLPASGCHAA
jgi:hypothetical protein